MPKSQNHRDLHEEMESLAPQVTADPNELTY